MGTEVAVKCTDCGSRNLEEDFVRGERSCLDCGLVLAENIIDPGKDWTDFDGDTDKARAGPPASVMWHDKGLSTDIHWRNTDFAGKKIVGSRSQLYRMRKWQNRTRASNSADRNLAQALNELNRLASKIGLHRQVREEAAMLYRRAVQDNLVRGRSVEGVAAAALYGACRRCEVPRTLTEITEASRASKKEVGRTYRYISRELKLNLQPASPSVYIVRFCRELELPGDVENTAISILNQAIAAELTSGRGPTGVAAAAIYIASVVHDQRKTQKTIADTVGVTEVTIRNRYKELAKNLDIVVYL